MPVWHKNGTGNELQPIMFSAITVVVTLFKLKPP